MEYADPVFSEFGVIDCGGVMGCDGGRLWGVVVGVWGWVCVYCWGL